MESIADEVRELRSRVQSLTSAGVLGSILEEISSLKRSLADSESHQASSIGYSNDSLRRVGKLPSVSFSDTTPGPSASIVVKNATVPGTTPFFSDHGSVTKDYCIHQVLSDEGPVGLRVEHRSEGRVIGVRHVETLVDPKVDSEGLEIMYLKGSRASYPTLDVSKQVIN